MDGEGSTFGGQLSAEDLRKTRYEQLATSNEKRRMLMCGIVGYIGNKFVDSLLIAGLERLEYRGYDSAGIATLNKGKLKI